MDRGACPEEPQRSLVCYSPPGHKELDTLQVDSLPSKLPGKPKGLIKYLLRKFSVEENKTQRSQVISSSIASNHDL